MGLEIVFGLPHVWRIVPGAKNISLDRLSGITQLRVLLDLCITQDAEQESRDSMGRDEIFKVSF